jgi:hypothetical protein
MNDFNNFNKPEPVVTVRRQLTSKNTVWLVLLLLVVAVGAGAFWIKFSAPKPVAVVEEPVEMPLSEVETEIYRESVERVTPPSEGEQKVVEINDQNITEITKEEVAELQSSSAQQAAFVPPAAAQAVSLDTLMPAGEPVVDTPYQDQGPTTVYTEGDVTILDFSMDSNTTAGEPVTLSGVVYSYDGGLGKLAITSNGNLFTVTTNGARVTTKDGKLLDVAKLKKGDVIEVGGTKVIDSSNVAATTITFTGVQEYNVVF